MAPAVSSAPGRKQPVDCSEEQETADQPTNSRSQALKTDRGSTIHERCSRTGCVLDEQFQPGNVAGRPRHWIPRNPRSWSAVVSTAALMPQLFQRLDVRFCDAASAVSRPNVHVHWFASSRSGSLLPRRAHLNTFTVVFRDGVSRLSYVVLTFLAGEFVAAGLRLRATQGQRVWLLCRCRLLWPK
jgi:hypothetical protein